MQTLLATIVLVCTIVGAVLGTRSTQPSDRQPVHADLRLRGRLGLLGRSLLPGAALGGALSAMTLYGTQRLGPAESGLDGTLSLLAALSPFPAVVAVYALAHGLPVWARTPSSLDTAATPASTLAGDRNYTLLRAAAWLVFSLILAIETTSYGTWVTDALTLTGIIGGTVCVLAGTAWPTYALTTTRYSIRGQLPRRLAPFLADMNRFGVLGTIGAAYCFRHDHLQKHLAASARTTRSNA